MPQLAGVKPLVSIIRAPFSNLPTEWPNFEGERKGNEKKYNLEWAHQVAPYNWYRDPSILTRIKYL